LLIDPECEAVELTAMCSLTGRLLSIALLRRSITYEFRTLLIAGLFGGAGWRRRFSAPAIPILSASSSARRS
jgi:hypothetical protein